MQLIDLSFPRIFGGQIWRARGGVRSYSMPLRMFLCQICNKYARRTLGEILRHIRDVHRHFTGKVRCGISNCPSTVTSYDSLRHHLYKKHHKDVLKDTGENNSREFHGRLTSEPNIEMESSLELHPPDDSPRDDYAIDSITQTQTTMNFN